MSESSAELRSAEEAVISRPAFVVRLDASSPRVSAALLLRYDSARNGHSERVDSAPDGSLQADCWAAPGDDWPQDDCSEVDSAPDGSLQADCWAASVDDWPQDDCSEVDSAPDGSLQADCWAASVDDWPQDDCSEVDSAPDGSLQADCWAASV